MRSLVVFSWGYFCKDVFTQDICKCWGQDFFEKYLLTNERLKVYGKFACKVSMVPWKFMANLHAKFQPPPWKFACKFQPPPWKFTMKLSGPPCKFYIKDSRPFKRLNKERKADWNFTLKPSTPPESLHAKFQPPWKFACKFAIKFQGVGGVSPFFPHILV